MPLLYMAWLNSKRDKKFVSKKVVLIHETTFVNTFGSRHKPLLTISLTFTRPLIRAAGLVFKPCAVTSYITAHVSDNRHNVHQQNYPHEPGNDAYYAPHAFAYATWIS